MKHHHMTLRMTLIERALAKISRASSVWLVFGIVTISLTNVTPSNDAWAESPFHAPLTTVVTPPPSPPSEPVQHLSYQVGGVVITETRQVVALRVDDKPWRVLMTGDRVPGGGVIRRINLDNIILHHQGRTISLKVPR